MGFVGGFWDLVGVGLGLLRWFCGFCGVCFFGGRIYIKIFIKDGK